MTQRRRLLAAFLNESANEVLGVRLENLVDLVEDRVDVLGQFLVALGDVGGGLGGLVDLVLGGALRAGLAAFMSGHRMSLLALCNHPNSHVGPIPGDTATVSGHER